MAKHLTALAPVYRGDFTIKPFVNHKTYRVSSENYNERGYSINQALYYKYPLPVSASKKNIFRNATTGSDGTYDYIQHNSVKHLFYRKYREKWYDTFEGHNSLTTEKHLYLTASILSTPYFERGEKIHPTSIILTSGSLSVYDDGYGNLYDPDKDTSLYMDSSYLDFWLDFEDMHDVTILGTINSYTGDGTYRSYTHIPSTQVYFKQVGLEPGVNSGAESFGSAAHFKTNSYIKVSEREELNHDKVDNFTIDFFIKLPVSQSITGSISNTILAKNNVEYRTKYGTVDTYTKNDTRVRRTIMSSSYDIDSTTQYPYRFEVYNQTAGSDSGKLLFTRSDGTSLVSLTSSLSISDNNYHHVAAVKSGSAVSLYVDGELSGTTSDVLEEVYNKYEVMIGASDHNFSQALSGSIDNLRFYSAPASSVQVSQSLSQTSNATFLQTNRVGNVFYRQGVISLTSLEKRYHDILKGNWNLIYKNTHTTYEYETVCKVKKGTFNGTMNPSARKSVKSQQLNEDFTDGTLSPYITTIGLYDRHMNLLAVGKLGRPIKTRDDVDLNFIVRWDY